MDTDKFPDFKSFVEDLHESKMKVILWATSMINTDNPDYKMCVENDYLVRDSRGFVRPLSWWHGDGGLLDYSNPEAVEWWHKQMDKVLDITGDGSVGVDGFKCDGTDPYIIEYELTGGAMGYDNKTISYREYADYYYRDFLYYTREKRNAGSSSSSAGLIWSRPVDCEVSQVSKVTYTCIYICVCVYILCIYAYMHICVYVYMCVYVLITSYTSKWLRPFLSTGTRYKYKRMCCG